MFVDFPMMFQQMPHPNFPLHCFTLTIIIILIRTSNGDEHRYEICSSSKTLLSCGNLTKLGYPFWGDVRPIYCGHPAFQLHCYEVRGKYYPALVFGDDDDDNDKVHYCVHGVQNFSQNMTIQLREYHFPFCHYHQANRVFEEIFQYNESVENITLYYECQRLEMPNVFNVSKSCWGKNTTTAYYPENKTDARIFNSCKHIEVPVLKKELDLLYHDHKSLYNVLDQGFNVDFLNFSACFECQNSGGVCGSSDDKQFACFRKPQNSEHWKLILGLAILGGFLILVVALNVGFWWRMKSKFHSHKMLMSRRLSTDPIISDLDIGSSLCGIPVFPYSELQEATNNFDESQELGDGGYGIVYYGKLRDGREVAVKRLYEKNYKRMAQFMNEIEILTCLRHPNLVTLYGCTSRSSRELLLVYEYISNGTIADHLYGERKGPETLTWAIRMKIATETASALSYLHASDIIHRDVKTNNILLDNNFSVKVADFGLSRLFPGDATHVSTAPQGTPGYLDPEYHKFYQVTNKSDVYSFGVVLVELISSLPAVDLYRQEDEINLSDYAMNRIQKGIINELVDQELGFESDCEVKRMITLIAELAFRCLQQEKELRPSMEEVVEALQQIEIADYEAFEAKDIDRPIAPSKPNSEPGDSTNQATSRNSEHPASPNSVIISWASKSSASNTSR